MKISQGRSREDWGRLSAVFYPRENSKFPPELVLSLAPIDARDVYPLLDHLPQGAHVTESLNNRNHFFNNKVDLGLRSEPANSET